MHFSTKNYLKSNRYHTIKHLQSNFMRASLYFLLTHLRKMKYVPQFIFITHLDQVFIFFHNTFYVYYILSYNHD